MINKSKNEVRVEKALKKAGLAFSRKYIMGTYVIEAYQVSASDLVSLIKSSRLGKIASVDGKTGMGVVIKIK